jgi:hypothetical protein
MELIDECKLEHEQVVTFQQAFLFFVITFQEHLFVVSTSLLID